jgi:hypothetical protein
MTMPKTYLYSAIVLFCLLSCSNAQKIEKSNITQEQTAYLKVIQENELAKSFYDKLIQGEKTKNYQWSLTKAFSSQGISPSKKDGKETTTMVLKKDPLKVRISITEHYSTADAGFPLTFITEQGLIKDCKGDLCGDEGQKIYSNQGFISLRFRKDNYFVYITCNSEETAMRFAGYALKAIAEKPLKSHLAN